MGITNNYLTSVSQIPVFYCPTIRKQPWSASLKQTLTHYKHFFGFGLLNFIIYKLISLICALKLMTSIEYGASPVPSTSNNFVGKCSPHILRIQFYFPSADGLNLSLQLFSAFGRRY